MGKTKVLVVDDSAFMRKVLTDILGSCKEIEVVATAKNGLDALKKLEQFEVDVVTLDVEMPEMDGLAALKKIMERWSLPVVMISAYTKYGVEATIKALEYGAVDFVTKPDGPISLQLKKSDDEIIEKVLTAAKVNTKLLRSGRKGGKTTAGKARVSAHVKKDIHSGQIVVIGTSTGGPPALEQVVSRLPADMATPVLIVQHMPPGFTESLAKRLDNLSSLHITEAVDGEVIEGGRVYLAPGNYHMEIERKRENGRYVDRIKLNQNERIGGLRPCVDVTFKSVAQIYRNKTVGVLLTGMGSDGTLGFRTIKSLGGVTIAQDKKTCVIYGMPKSAVDAGLVDYVAPLDGISEKIIECLSS